MSEIVQDALMPTDASVNHTVLFFQSAFTIILALSLGEALKSFTSDDQDQPLYWDRAPTLLAFLFIFVPYFQSMSEYFYSAYLNPQTALAFRPAYLIFDGILFTIEAGCFFTMSRSLAPHRWRRFYTTFLILTLLDIGWGVVSAFRGIDVLGWLYLDVFSIVAVLAMLWYWRNRPASMQPSLAGLALVMTTTALGYVLEPDMYLP